MASELSKFIDQELLREGATGERSRLLNRHAFSTEKAQPRKTSFSRLCSKRGLCCAFLLVVVAVVVISSLSTKDGSASQKVIGWARSKGQAAPSGAERQPFPEKETGQTDVAISDAGKSAPKETAATKTPRRKKGAAEASVPVPAPEPEAALPAPEPSSLPAPAPQVAGPSGPAVGDAAAGPVGGAPEPSVEALAVKPKRGKRKGGRKLLLHQLQR